MLPAVSLASLGGSDVVSETKLKLFEHQISGDPLEFCKFNPSQVFHLTVSEKFLVGFADHYNSVLLGNERTVDKILGRRWNRRLKDPSL